MPTSVFFLEPRIVSDNTLSSNGLPLYLGPHHHLVRIHLQYDTRGCPSCQSSITSYPYSSLLLPGPAGHTMSSHLPRIPTLPPFSTLLWNLKTEDQESPRFSHFQASILRLFQSYSRCPSKAITHVNARGLSPSSVPSPITSLRSSPSVAITNSAGELDKGALAMLVMLDTVQPSSQMDLRRS